jgi:hypothetical protein
MTDRQLILEVARRIATLERLTLLLIQGEGQIIMDQATEIALIEKAANLLTTLEAEVANGLVVPPAVEAALADLQAAVDAGSAQTPAADGSGTVVAAPNGSDTTGDSSADQTVDATADGGPTPA